MILVHRWWYHIWSRPTWKAITYLVLVGFRALMYGSLAMVASVGAPLPLRITLASLIGAVMGIIMSIVRLRAYLGEDW